MINDLEINLLFISSLISFAVAKSSLCSSLVGSSCLSVFASLASGAFYKNDKINIVACFKV